MNSSIADQVLSAVRRVAGNSPAALHEPVFAGRELDYLRECVETGWVSSAGPFVDRFEQMLVDYTGARHAIAVVNGTAALHVALLGVGVDAGSEVLVPALTFIGTVNPVAYCGATPHFVDVTPGTLGIDPAALNLYLTEIAEVQDGVCRNRITGARISAVLPVHIFGHMVDMDALNEVAARFHLPVVEDAAEAIGSCDRGMHAGTRGAVGTLSFNGNKTITTGGGGALLTDDPLLAARMKHLSTTARVSHRWQFVHDMVGYNYRLPNINAALGCAQLEQLDGFIARKRKLTERYAAAFSEVSGATLVREPRDTRSNYWLQAILLDPEHASRRDEVLDALNDAGYMARPVWLLMNKMPMFESCPRMPLPVTEDIERRLINLPSGAGLVP
jgi:perosamine synthetase